MVYAIGVGLGASSSKDKTKINKKANRKRNFVGYELYEHYKSVIDDKIQYTPSLFEVRGEF